MIGCTSYQRLGWTGGYTDLQLNNNLYKVSFYGNGWTSYQRVYSFFLRRAAEITISKEHDFFILVDENRSSETVNISSTATVTRDSVWGDRVRIKQNNVTKHSHTGLIKIFKKGSEPSSAMDAKLILSQMGVVTKK